MMRIAGRNNAGVAKPIKTDRHGKIETNNEELVEYALESFEGYGGMTIKFKNYIDGFVLSNDGNEDLEVVIDIIDEEFKVKAGEVFEATLPSFMTLRIIGNSPYRGYGKIKKVNFKQKKHYLIREGAYKNSSTLGDEWKGTEVFFNSDAVIKEIGVRSDATKFAIFKSTGSNILGENIYFSNITENTKDSKGYLTHSVSERLKLEKNETYIFMAFQESGTIYFSYANETSPLTVYGTDHYLDNEIATATGRRVKVTRDMLTSEGVDEPVEGMIVSPYSKATNTIYDYRFEIE